MQHITGQTFEKLVAVEYVCLKRKRRHHDHSRQNTAAVGFILIVVGCMTYVNRPDCGRVEGEGEKMVSHDKGLFF